MTGIQGNLLSLLVWEDSPLQRVAKSNHEARCTTRSCQQLLSRISSISGITSKSKVAGKC